MVSKLFARGTRGLKGRVRMDRFFPTEYTYLSFSSENFQDRDYTNMDRLS
jgi:hypothetical protein